jgi:two-component system, chemotaxis family, response regulator WspF
MRIGVVNDMTIAVEAIRRVVVNSPGHELAWVAQDGSEAVAFCAQDPPDLVLMDLIMPQMDGVEATRKIMQDHPCPIIIVTADVNKNSAKVFEAMGAGALDAVDTPVLGRYGNGENNPLLGKIQTINRLVAKPRIITAERGLQSSKPRFPLVAIGASTGGPSALATVLSEFPRDFSAAIVIIQHMDFQFARELSGWLQSQTRMKVQLAREGDSPMEGTVLLAASEDHLVFTKPKRLGYSPLPYNSSFKPSIDVFFQSVQRFWTGDVIGLLLTGMGRDGAEGLKSLRDAGHLTVVQDRATSAVYGMPKAAIDLQAACEILPIEQIGIRLRNRVNEKIKLNGRD